MNVDEPPLNHASNNTVEPVSNGTYIDETDDVEDECEPMISNPRRRRRSKSLNLRTPKKISLRSYVLALSLAIILFVFWLLDSLKDPTFVLLVDGDLNRHQPWAKIVSVWGNIGILIILEVFSSHDKDMEDDGEAATEAQSMDDTHILNPHHFQTMSISTERYYKKRKEQETSKQHAIPIIIFQILGTIYILILLCISYFLSQHVDLTSNNNNNNSSITGDIQKQNHVWWYVLGYFIYLIIESFGSICIVTFWSFADTNLSISMAKRSYGLIIATGQIGAIAGSTLATVETLSTSTKIRIACLGIGLQMIVMKLYGYWFRTCIQDNDDEEDKDNNENMIFVESSSAAYPFTNQDPMYHGSTGMVVVTNPLDGVNNIFTILNKYMSGVFLILQHYYLLLILGVSCLHEVSLTCLDYEMKLMGLAKFESGVSFTTFMGRYGQLTNILSFLLSYFAFPYLMKRYGVKLTLRIFPTLLIAINFLTYIAMPENLTVLFTCLSLLKAMTYSINEPTHEILYIPTSNVIKFKAKFWIDVVGARIAKGIGSFINTYAGNLDRAIQYGSLPSIATALGLFLACYAVGLEFETLTRHETVG